MQPNLRLWGFRTSPYVGKVRVVLAEKDVAAALVDIHPVDRPARLRELNPTGRVPVLEVGDVALRESAVICEWLEEAYPDPPLWPQDPARRAWGRGVARWLDDEPTRAFFVGMRKLAFGLAPDDPPDAVDRLHGRLPGCWRVLEDLLARFDGPWLLGEDLSLADLAAVPLAVRLPEWGAQLQPDAGEHPRAAAWLEALRARPSAAAVDRRGERLAA